MTDEEWESGDDPGPMLALLDSRPPPQGRKRKLLLCALARHLLGDDKGGARIALEAVEAWADSLGDDPRGPAPPRSDVYDALLGLDPESERQHAAARLLALATVGEKSQWATAVMETRQYPVLARLLREVFPPPLRRVLRVREGMHRRVRAWPADRRPRAVLFVPAWAEWQGGLPARLARSIAERRAWDEMPVLGDALEEAGCDEPAVLSHLRGEGPHVRGCWVLDLVLARE